MATTLYDKLWNAHVVAQRPGHPAVLYVDLHLLHDGTYHRAFRMLEEQGLRVRDPARAVGTTDHCLPTRTSFTVMRSGPAPAVDVVAGLVAACERHGIRVYGPDHEHQGIVHVIGPELGLVQPGMTVACADSHTTTLGAMGALPLAIGTTQVLHALATQCTLQRRARTMRVDIDGTLRAGVSAKDVILALIARHGIDLGVGHAVEFAGAAVRAMSMEARLTLCNMGAEIGARAALIAPDDVTFEYLRGRPFAPSGAAFDAACARWGGFVSDDDAVYDRVVRFDAGEVAPMVTFGTTPAMGVAVTGRVGDPAQSASAEGRRELAAALDYMQLEPGRAVDTIAVGTVFIGSCTNSRLDDLRAAASVLRTGRVPANVRLLVVPGSQAVRQAAEREGIADIVRAAGGEWGVPGCSLCVAMNDEVARPGEFVASTSNRNFQGRQGPGTRTLLMSPVTAAASALAGRVADPRPCLERQRAGG